MTTLTAPGVKVQGREFYLTGGRTWSGSIPLRGFYGLRSRFFFFSDCRLLPHLSWTNGRTGATARVELFVLVLTRPGHHCSHSSWLPPLPPSDDQLGPTGLSPLLPIKRIISNLRTCATLGLAVDLQTRQVVPPASPLPPPSLLPQHLAVPQLSARPVQGFYFYFISAKWKLAFFPFLNCPLSVDLGRRAISITLTAAAAAALSSPGKPSEVFTRRHSPSRVI